MDSNLKKLVDDLQAWFTPWRSVLVAYSGGVDSSLVMAAAHAAPGTRALACIGVSPSYPRREMREAVALAEALEVPYRLVDTEEHLDQRYTVNDARRCFFCKDELYGRLRVMAADEAWDLIANKLDIEPDAARMRVQRLVAKLAKRASSAKANRDRPHLYESA